MAYYLIGEVHYLELRYLIISFSSVFFCVLLHELGHSIAARKLGVSTKDILLTPIGGLARLRNSMLTPNNELRIAVAGPAINLILSIIIITILVLNGRVNIFLSADLGVAVNFWHFLNMLFVINFILFAFNLIPAFPMDGGRILRALLSLRMDRLKATKLASYIGKIFAVIFLIIGYVYKIYALLFIAILLYFMAEKEYVSELKAISNVDRPD